MDVGESGEEAHDKDKHSTDTALDKGKASTDTASDKGKTSALRESQVSQEEAPALDKHKKATDKTSTDTGLLAAEARDITPSVRREGSAGVVGGVEGAGGRSQRTSLTPQPHETLVGGAHEKGESGGVDQRTVARQVYSPFSTLFSDNAWDELRYHDSEMHNSSPAPQQRRERCTPADAAVRERSLDTPIQPFERVVRSEEQVEGTPRSASNTAAAGVFGSEGHSSGSGLLGYREQILEFSPRQYEFSARQESSPRPYAFSARQEFSPRPYAFSARQEFSPRPAQGGDDGGASRATPRSASRTPRSMTLPEILDSQRERGGRVVGSAQERMRQAASASRRGTEAGRVQTGTDNWDDLVLGSIGFAPELMTDDADYDQLCSACSSAASSPRKHYDPDAGSEVDGMDTAHHLGGGGGGQEVEAGGAGGAGVAKLSEGGFRRAEESGSNRMLNKAPGERGADKDTDSGSPGVAAPGAAPASPGLPASASDSEKKQRAEQKRAAFLATEARQAAAKLRSDETGQRAAGVSTWGRASQEVHSPRSTPRAHELASSPASEQKRGSELGQREQRGMAGPRPSPANASGPIKSSGGGALVNVGCRM